MWNHQAAETPRQLPRHAALLIPVLLLVQPLVARAQVKDIQVGGSATPRQWSRLYLADPVGRRAASRALDVASEWLADPDCAKALSALTDQAGQPLAHRLAAFSLDLPTYLTLVVFVDGSRDTPCMRGAFACTSPGSRVVRLCVDELKRAWLQADPRQVVALVIHEMLHTLGQGEDPPTSAELTQLVLKACGSTRSGSNIQLARR